MRLDGATPFILLDDASADRRPARLYRAPQQVIRADALEEVRPALSQLAEAQRSGAFVAGFLSYEAGQALDRPPERPLAPPAGLPWLWFGLFDRFEMIDAGAVAALLPDPAGAWASAPKPQIDRQEYGRRIARVLELIRAGDIYQANLTFRAAVRTGGSPLALYSAIRERAGAGHGGIVWTGKDWLLSFSPELFFSLDNGRLNARPMKGTAPRGTSAEEDATLARQLAEDPKQRAENLMILDLMRNDLSRVARPGSVTVPERFKVETYPTVHQMVSAVTADLQDGLGAIDVVEALFPCGSITGAPKLRASEIIREVEGEPRGAYTGSIGHIDPDGSAGFNVAIRTLHLRDGENLATLGLGSGVVADSQAQEEWQECLDKGSFVTAGQHRFDLIETMAFDPEQGIALLERHLERMKASAELFGFAFDRHVTRNELQAATFRLRKAARVRLTLGSTGAIAIGVAPMPERRDDALRAAVVPLPVDAGDFRLRHKTSNRSFYDTARHASGADEVLFVDPRGYLTEGSFTSIFVERDGRLVTPPLDRGLLPGVLRAELLATGEAVEGELLPADLAGGFLLGNALRGLMPAVAVAELGSRAL